MRTAFNPDLRAERVAIGARTALYAVPESPFAGRAPNSNAGFGALRPVVESLSCPHFGLFGRNEINPE